MWPILYQKPKEQNPRFLAVKKFVEGKEYMVRPCIHEWTGEMQYIAEPLAKLVLFQLC